MINFVVDTGANVTIIDESISRRLNLHPVGNLSIRGVSPSGLPAKYKIFDVDLYLLDANGRTIVVAETLQVASAKIESGDGVSGLLGTDILKNLRFSYDGPAREFFVRS